MDSWLVGRVNRIRTTQVDGIQWIRHPQGLALMQTITDKVVHFISFLFCRIGIDNNKIFSPFVIVCYVETAVQEVVAVVEEDDEDDDFRYEMLPTPRANNRKISETDPGYERIQLKSEDSFNDPRYERIHLRNSGVEVEPNYEVVGFR